MVWSIPTIQQCRKWYLCWLSKLCLTLLQMLSSKHFWLYVCWMGGDDGKRGGTPTRGIICAIVTWRRVSLPDDLSLPFQQSFITIIPIHTAYPPQLLHSPFSCFRLHSQYSSCLALFLPCTSLSLNPTHFTKCTSRKVYSMLLPINCLKLFRLDGITVIHFFNVIFRSVVANGSLYNMS